MLAGVDWLLSIKSRSLREEAGKLEQQLQKQTPQLEMLNAEIKRLTPQQREQVTEMEFQMYEIRERLDELLAKIEEMNQRGKAASQPSVRVVGCVYPGTELYLGKQFTVINHLVVGPVIFQLVEMAIGPIIVAKSASGHVETLRTSTAKDPLRKVQIPELPADYPAVPACQPKENT